MSATQHAYWLAIAAALTGCAPLTTLPSAPIAAPPNASSEATSVPGAVSLPAEAPLEAPVPVEAPPVPIEAAPALPAPEAEVPAAVPAATPDPAYDSSAWADDFEDFWAPEAPEKAPRPKKKRKEDAS